MKKILYGFAMIAAMSPAAAQNKIVAKSFSNVKSIQVNTSSGNISITKSPDAKVNVSLVHTYDEDAFAPIMEMNNGNLILKEEFKRGTHSGNSSWALAVPDNLQIKMNSGSGDVVIGGINTDLKFNLGSGNVELTEVKGKVDCNTGSGDIRISGTDGKFSFNTGSGNIDAENGNGSYALNAGSGDIELNALAGTLEANTGSGNIDARDIDLKGDGKFNSGSGNTEVVLAGPLNHSISINSGSGDAELDFNGSPIEGEVVMTANERGGEIVAPFEFDKEEIIDEGNSQRRLRKTARLGTKGITIKIGTGTGTAAISN